MTMELIQHIELGSAQANITFNSIPTSYDDLKIVFSGRGTDDAPSVTWRDINLRFNGSSSGYSWRYLYGDGSSRASDGNSSQAQIFMGGVPDSATTASTFGNVEIYIPNYRSAVAKSASIDIVTENNATMAMQMIVAGLWSGTDAINSVSLTIAAANLAAGSSATLYGIKRFNTTLSPKATGGAISYDSVNNKWVHAFYTSGTFTPTENLTGVEYLVIAGGGGASRLGGAGAGGYRSSVVGESSGGGGSAESTLSLTSGVGYTVTIGAGGAGTEGGPTASGSNSVFHTITSTGGGFGAITSPNRNGGNGGSGGGAWPVGSGGSGTTNQGFAGGAASSVTSPFGGGGGGGAGAVGGNQTGSFTGGPGGNGLASNITGTSTTRAGGGAGGDVNSTSVSGGSGGGGSSPSNKDGSPNTGGGGGAGGGSAGVGGNGGSGLVIVRYSA